MSKEKHPQDQPEIILAPTKPKGRWLSAFEMAETFIVPFFALIYAFDTGALRTFRENILGHINKSGNVPRSEIPKLKSALEYNAKWSGYRFWGGIGLLFGLGTLGWVKGKREEDRYHAEMRKLRQEGYIPDSYAQLVIEQRDAAKQSALPTTAVTQPVAAERVEEAQLPARNI